MLHKVIEIYTSRLEKMRIEFTKKHYSEELFSDRVSISHIDTMKKDMKQNLKITLENFIKSQLHELVHDQLLFTTAWEPKRPPIRVFITKFSNLFVFHISI